MASLDPIIALDPIAWPYDLLKPRGGGPPILDPRNMSAGGSLSGTEQIVSSGRGVWKVKYRFVLQTEEKYLAWMAIDAQAQGRRVPMLVPHFGFLTKPFIAGQKFQQAFVPHSDNSLFSDNESYASPTIQATVAVDRDYGSTDVRILLIEGRKLEAGMIFSHKDHWYKIAKVTNRTENGTVYWCTISPTLRFDMTVGQPCEFARPVCRMTLASDLEMTLDTEAPLIASPEVNWIEDLTDAVLTNS